MKLRGALASAAFATLLPLAACDTTSDAPTDAGLTDADAKGDTNVTDAARDASLCCPVDPPSNACDCTRLGGIPDALGRCPRAPCDLGQKYAAYVDENGCPALKVLPNDGTVRCNVAPRDAGADASDASDAGAP